MMTLTTLAQLEWTNPWWSLLALQPLLMMLLLKLRRQQVLHYAEAHLLPWVMRENVQGPQGRWRELFNLLAWILLAGSLAGPRLPLVSDQAHQQARQEHRIDIMLLLDVSPSMLARDISPQRLQRAKLELLDLIPRLHGERIGLIAFSGSAGMLMPLNRDEAALRYYLNIADPSLFDTPGTALASALELALRNLSQKNDTDHKVKKLPHSAILLLTDAETSALSGPAGAAVWDAADKLKQAGVPLFILGVGTEQGATITQADGNTLVSEGVDVVSKMDAAGFGDLAAKTDGKFVQVADGDADWQALYDHGLLNVPGAKATTENVHSWQELYAYFLLPALLLFVFLHFDYLFNIIKLLGVKHLVVLMLLFSAAAEVHAAESEAYGAYHAQKFAQAQMLYAVLPGYAARMGEGATAYRRKDYPYAIAQFSRALLEAVDSTQREQALFNLGNSYYMASNYLAAADTFLGVLNYAPQQQSAVLRQNARANLAMAAGKLSEIAKANKKSTGVLGHRGRDTGGGLGDDAEDQPLSIEPSDDKKDKTPGVGSELADDALAVLKSKQSGSGSQASTIIERDMAYRAALKKLELLEDHPIVLHKSLLKIEANRDYTPQLEMPPW
jgi:Ca-activated chloride channel family protein